MLWNSAVHYIAATVSSPASCLFPANNNNSNDEGLNTLHHHHPSIEAHRERVEKTSVRHTTTV